MFVALWSPCYIRAPRRGQKLCVKWLKPSPVDKFHEVEPASECKTPPECEDTESINLRRSYGQAIHYSLRLSSRFQLDHEWLNNGFYASVIRGKPIVEYVCGSRLEIRSPSRRATI
ncbi:hypothetical protein PGT21_034319 [Puccinia graminis f. sp. tritici]|uniref:Uncharacterized protein n=1 Tax=Puccinia graminis f. sp. tritici TaxID=56615 RepID=A0A5B0PPS7_PUCGR|nr:hypothetical protein PGT21_034319 [Puccinia graminis f. sp. tritici]